MDSILSSATFTCLTWTASSFLNISVLRWTCLLSVLWF
uniref:Uncharacterized protein n=1 Tax=Brassica oleracea TaxID=3712 RepID=A0A3P6AMD5_BRAOL|nr:unnamed protein product [Brassica oleracea]